MESPRRDLLNYMAQYMSILKNNQNTCYLSFSFIPKTGKTSLKQLFRFYCEGLGQIKYGLFLFAYWLK